MSLPDFEVESKLIKKGYRAIAGVDEVGRGCIAGPVTAAAVILDPENIPKGLNDSKKLSLKNREKIFHSIQNKCTFYVAHSSVSEIDEINILQASLLAMKRAIDGLSISPDFVLIDGNKSPEGLDSEFETIIKGDSKSLSIAAASIVAKVYEVLNRTHVEIWRIIPIIGQCFCNRHCAFKQQVKSHFPKTKVWYCYN